MCVWRDTRACTHAAPLFSPILAYSVSNFSLSLEIFYWTFNRHLMEVCFCPYCLLQFRWALCFVFWTGYLVLFWLFELVCHFLLDFIGDFSFAILFCRYCFFFPFYSFLCTVVCTYVLFPFFSFVARYSTVSFLMLTQSSFPSASLSFLCPMLVTSPSVLLHLSPLPYVSLFPRFPSPALLRPTCLWSRSKLCLTPAANLVMDKRMTVHADCLHEDKWSLHGVKQKKRLPAGTIRGVGINRGKRIQLSRKFVHMWHFLYGDKSSSIMYHRAAILFVYCSFLALPSKRRCVNRWLDNFSEDSKNFAGRGTHLYRKSRRV